MFSNPFLKSAYNTVAYWCATSIRLLNTHHTSVYRKLLNWPVILGLTCISAIFCCYTIFIGTFVLWFIFTICHGELDWSLFSMGFICRPPLFWDVLYIICVYVVSQPHARRRMVYLIHMFTFPT